MTKTVLGQNNTCDNRKQKESRKKVTTYSEINKTIFVKTQIKEKTACKNKQTVKEKNTEQIQKICENRTVLTQQHVKKLTTQQNYKTRA